jgi:hypothetical protein
MVWYLVTNAQKIVFYINILNGYLVLPRVYSASDALSFVDMDTQNMSSVSSEAVSQEVDKLKTDLLSAVGTDAERHISRVLQRMRSAVDFLKRPATRPDRNTIPEDTFAQHKGADTVIVCSFEVGECVKCSRIGAVGHCCEKCGGDIFSHLAQGTVPTHLVNLPNVYFDTEPGPQSKKRKRTKKWSPKSLDDLVKTFMFAEACEMAGNQEDYPDSCVDDILEGDDDDDLREHLIELFREAHGEWSGLLEKYFAEDIKKRQQIDIGNVRLKLRAWVKNAKKKKKKRKKR